MDTINIRGARTHNLKNINLTLPRNKLIVITGLSGSGKSSLAFDTLYAEGQRRYVESLSAYARQFLSLMEKPDVDHIEGLSPAISIEQKSTSHNPRSTVGTITEIYDYLRLLFARIGIPRCPEHDIELKAQTVSQMVDHVLALPENSKCMLLAPVIRGRKGEYQQLLNNLQQQGYIRARINGELVELADAPELERYQKHDIEVVVDRFKVRDDIKQRLADSFETTLDLANGLAMISFIDGSRDDIIFSARHACPVCGYSIEELEPKLFSFNNPAGACPDCNGLGVKQFFDVSKVVPDPSLSLAQGAIRGWGRNHFYYYQQLCGLAEHFDFDMTQPFSEIPKAVQDVILYGSGDDEIPMQLPSHRNQELITRTRPFAGVVPTMQRRYHEAETGVVREELGKFMASQTCPTCSGSRLNTAARNVYINQLTLPQISQLSISDAFDTFKNLNLSGQNAVIADKILNEICARLEFLINVGLNYLMLSRQADSLSGGEAQRIRLASQIGAGLVGVMYVLDEPSIGLHQRDNERLLKTLFHLRDLGNTVIVVEHDEDAIRSADYVVDMGPGAGVHGGNVVAEGEPKAIMQATHSLTGDYLSGIKKIEIPKKRLKPTAWIDLKGANGNNLNNVNVKFPIGIMTCITGVSGSGKSTLINQTFYPLAAQKLNGSNALAPKPFKSIKGLDQLDKVVDIDQSPIGRTPRSNPATYTGMFTPIRELFAATQEARARGYKPGRFSFNVKGGRCEACQGDGLIKVEMHFLPDVYVPCDACKAKRYNRETLEVLYKGKNIHDVLEMTIETACDFFANVPSIANKCKTLFDVGLGYIKLGQAATTLSGGEAQRVKLSRELAKRDTGKTLYILDEPTTGLHFYDIQQLLAVLERLRERGNTIIVIEHNLDVIKTADWIIDLGPEGGSGGGQIIASGTPEDIAKIKKSHTGQFLKPLLTTS